MERRRIVFSGRVQGVGFRATARACAEGHAVTGWVRNEPDGTVAMEIQGECAEIEATLRTLRGRMAGLIRSEDSMAIGVEAGERGFEIRR